MFRLFKKTIELKAAATGRCIPLEEMADEAFASKALGDGVAIVPADETVGAPCDGTIALVPPTKHAFVVQRDDGQQILVHVGIDTVMLSGEGLSAFAKQGDPVRAGQPVIEFDSALMAEHGIDMTVAMVLLDAPDKHVEQPALGQQVTRGADVVVAYR